MTLPGVEIMLSQQPVQTQGAPRQLPKSRDSLVTSMRHPWEPEASRYRYNRPLTIEPVRRATEHWRPVVAYEGLYEVSDRGGVRSVLRTVTDTRGIARVFRSRTLRPTQEGNPGYLVVSLYRSRARQTLRVHTLVAEAFMGPRPPGMYVAHNDGDPSHSCLRNLRYATPVDNQADRLRHGTSNRGERNGWAALTAGDVAEIRRALTAGALQREIAADYGIARTTVSSIATGRSWGGI